MNKIFKYISSLMIAILTLPSITSCDAVHEWPDPLPVVPFHFDANFASNFNAWTEWHHSFDEVSVTENGKGDTYENLIYDTKMRYIIRIFEQDKNSRAASEHIKEIVMTKESSNGLYNIDFDLELVPGYYKLMMWADFMKENDSDEAHYDCSSFSEIKLMGEHTANSDRRDAFRGVLDLKVGNNVVSSTPKKYEIKMERPLAKFEFITEDVIKFIDKETRRIAAKGNSVRDDSQDSPETRVNLNSYKVVFYYVGFMPNTYNMHTDKPVDSSTGVFFESTLKKLSETEASMGFDYVFVNGVESAVTVQVAIFDDEGTQLSLSAPIKIPLRRSHHTIMRGTFLTSEATGGVAINPDFDGEFNLIIP